MAFLRLTDAIMNIREILTTFYFNSSISGEWLVIE